MLFRLGPTSVPIRPSSAVLRLLLLAVLGGCANDSSEPRGDVTMTTASDREPLPHRFSAKEIRFERCPKRTVTPEHFGVPVRRTGIGCSKARELGKRITQGFSDRNLDNRLVSRGNGWRCHQREFLGGFGIALICWRGDVVIEFKKK